MASGVLRRDESKKMQSDGDVSGIRLWPQFCLVSYATELAQLRESDDLYVHFV